MRRELCTILCLSGTAKYSAIKDALPTRGNHLSEFVEDNFDELLGAVADKREADGDDALQSSVLYMPKRALVRRLHSLLRLQYTRGRTSSTRCTRPCARIGRFDLP